MKTDYPEFDKKEVIIKNQFKAKIVACNFDVGITAQDDTGRKFCINGPSSPHWKRITQETPEYKTGYKKTFYKTVEMIKKGEIDHLEVNREIGFITKPHSSGNASCAYSGQ